MAQATSENPVVIDPNGDLILVIGTSKTISLRVQSKILSLASKVFLTMFSLPFKEGTGLASSVEPYSVSLPEDDPDAMTILCKLLHFQFSSFTQTPSSTQLRELASAAHKYDCVAAISVMTTKWLSDTQFHMDVDGDVYDNRGGFPDEDLLEASYLLKNHESFKVVTKQAVYARIGCFTAGPGDSTTEVLPTKVIGKLCP